MSIAKAMHIIGFTCWFAGLFYLVRLFVYHREALDQGDEKMASQFEAMERRLYYGITLPVMTLTLLFGLWLMDQVTVHFRFVGDWLVIKLVLVFMLVVYTHGCGRIYKALMTGRTWWTSGRLRVLNEVATVFLVFIVFIAVFKESLSLRVALGIVAGLVVVMVPGFLLFGKSARETRAAKRTEREGGV